jgi:hypothetical protein
MTTELTFALKAPSNQVCVQQVTIVQIQESAFSVQALLVPHSIALLEAKSHLCAQLDSTATLEGRSRAVYLILITRTSV